MPSIHVSKNKCPAMHSTFGGDALFYLRGLKYEWKLRDDKTPRFQVTVTATVCI